MDDVDCEARMLRDVTQSCVPDPWLAGIGGRDKLHIAPECGRGDACVHTPHPAPLGHAIAGTPPQGIRQALPLGFRKDAPSPWPRHKKARRSGLLPKALASLGEPLGHAAVA